MDALSTKTVLVKNIFQVTTSKLLKNKKTSWSPAEISNGFFKQCALMCVIISSVNTIVTFGW